MWYPPISVKLPRQLSIFTPVILSIETSNLKILYYQVESAKYVTLDWQTSAATEEAQIVGLWTTLPRKSYKGMNTINRLIFGV